MNKAKANILIVEDEWIVAEDIKSSLKNLGYSVADIVSSGEKVIAKVEEHKPDLVLMDIMLKGQMDGIEAASRIHSRFDIPVVYLTAYTDEKLLERAKITEPYGYIVKPFENRELSTAVEIALYKHRVEKELNESQKELKAIFDNMQDTFYRADIEGRIIMVSPSAQDLMQYTPEELLGQRLADYYVDTDGREKFLKVLENAGGRVYGYEAAVRRKDGNEVWVSTNAHIYFDESGNPVGVEGSIRDITKRKQVEKALLRANRALSAMGRCSQTLVHAADEEELLDAVCRIIADEGLYDLAWVGYAEHDMKKAVRPVARAGDKSGYLDKIELRWSDSKLGCGPVGTAIKTGKASVFNNVDTDSRFSPWLKNARKFGFKSVTSLPLEMNGQVFGALNIYSSEPDSFDGKEVDLLQRLADDLAFGIKTIRAEKERKKAESKLRSLQKALETTNMGVTIADMEWKILYTNPADAKMHGYLTEELIGKDVRIFAPPELYQKVNLQQLLNTKDRRRESINIRKDGTVFPVNLISDIVVDTSGEPVTIVTTCEDITERKQAEEALRISEERYALAMSGANDGLWDRDLKTGEVYFSPRWKEMLGYKEDEVPNKHKEWERRVHPDDIDNINRVRKEHFEGHAPYYVTEYRMKHRDGSYRWILTRGTTIRDEEGTPVRFAGSHTDITERKRMEEALLDQVKFINNTIESLPYPFMVIDAANCTIKLANSAASDKTLPEGMTCYKLLYNKRKPPKEKDLKCPLEELKMTGKPVKVEHLLKDKSGNMQYIEAHGYPIVDNDGNIVQMILYTIDITDRKKAEEELKESHEKLRSLAGHIESVREEERTAVARDIHDELGQVLTACKFDVSWASKQLRGDQSLVFERLDAASDHIDGAIQTVKKIATELRPTLLDDLGLTAAIEWQAEEFQNRTGIESNLVFGPWSVLLDREITTAVFRLFQETLTNVARHSEATKVYASLKGNDGHLVLEIVDNGKGITKKDMSATKSFGLLGMRERVFALGGEIDINGIKGKGTTVKAVIPIHKNNEREKR